MNARLAELDQDEQQRKRDQQAADAEIAIEGLQVIQGIIDEGYDNKIQAQDDNIASLQDKLSKATTDQQKQEIQAQIDSANAQKTALEKQKKSSQGFAIVAALISTYLSAQKAFTSQLIPGDPTSLIRAIAAATVATAAGLLNVAKIRGFAQGGEVPDERGEVKSSWGRRINRSNGDNVLTTLKTGEVVLNKDQQVRVKRKTGTDIRHLAELPGYRSMSDVMDDVQRKRQPMVDFIGSIRQGFAGGGVVGFTPPRPDPATIVQNFAIAGLNELANRPSVVNVHEITEAQNKVKVQEDTSSLR